MLKWEAMYPMWNWVSKFWTNCYVINHQGCGFIIQLLCIWPSLCQSCAISRFSSINELVQENEASSKELQLQLHLCKVHMFLSLLFCPALSTGTSTPTKWHRDPSLACSTQGNWANMVTQMMQLHLPMNLALGTWPHFTPVPKTSSAIHQVSRTNTRVLIWNWSKRNFCLSVLFFLL